MDFLPTVLGALPDLGSLGGALVILVIAFRWFASERTEWRAERAALIAEATDLRAELRTADRGRHALRESQQSRSG